MGKAPKRVSRARRKFTLYPELVPRPLWGISAYRLLRRRAPWKRIRNATLEEAGRRCSVCGETTPPLFCHERWCYNDKKGVALLEGFAIVCRDCNRAIHIGLAGVLGEHEAAIAHLCRVNRITEAEANVMVKRALTIWDNRSGKNWRVVVATTLLKIYPQLGVLGKKGALPTARGHSF